MVGERCSVIGARKCEFSTHQDQFVASVCLDVIENKVYLIW
jgi:hypothetical protein